VLAYYHEVAPVLLPHLRDRPLTLERYPEGVEGGSFYQKNAPAHYPEWLRTYSKAYRHSERVVHHPLVDDAADLLYLANLGVLTFHTFLSRTTDIEHPDLLVIDIDPPADPGRDSVVQSFAKAREAAQILRAELARAGLDPLVKTSGKRGLHLALPLDGTLGFSEARDVLSGLFEKAVALHPEFLTRDVAKGKKRSRVYLDALRMALGATVVAPYSVRPTPVASVSMPLTWEELERLDDPYLFTVRTAGERVTAVGDLWAPVRPSQ